MGSGNFFKEGTILQGLNDTNMVLIPKKKNPTKNTKLRPILLCNVLVKVITKVVANRLKEVLGDIISETHSAFIPGRLISDNIMVSYEVMHYLKRKMGFHSWFIHLVMKCVTSVSYKIFHCAYETDSINPHSGIRKGIHCPLICL